MAPTVEGRGGMSWNNEVDCLVGGAREGTDDALRSKLLLLANVKEATLFSVPYHSTGMVLLVWQRRGRPV